VVDGVYPDRVVDLAGQTLSVVFTSVCSGSFEAMWSLEDNELHLHVLRAGDPGDVVLFGGKPWRKIG